MFVLCVRVCVSRCPESPFQVWLVACVAGGRPVQVEIRHRQCHPKSLVGTSHRASLAY